jgi:tetratricopeptide (TPR) repeat protein
METTALVDELNALGVRLRDGGDVVQAAAIFSQVARMHPDDPIAAENAAGVQIEAGYRLAAAGDMTAARAAFATALAFAPNAFSAHWGSYETNLVLGNEAQALAHQRHALALQPIASRAASVAPAALTILALHVPGTFQANIPLDFVLDPARVTLHKWFLTDGPAPALPPHDLVFTAIADAPEIADAVRRAAGFIARNGKPAINAPYALAATSRDAVAGAFRESQTVMVAPLVQRTREAIRASHPAFPFLVRPLDSHAGDDLAKIDDAAALDAYLAATPRGDAFYCSHFVDYRNADGFFRKYRIAFVAGVPYPVHMAISPRWMIHYYNAPMAENAWMRDEEHAFMRDIHSVFDGLRAAALREIAAAIPLDYFGIDCSIAPDGRVLLFEASAAMLVHANDPVDVFPYKAQYVPRIFRALEELFAKRLARTPFA